MARRTGRRACLETDMDLDTVVCADALDWLRTLPDESVNCIITSPPYYGLRDYGADGQLGLEDTPEAYVARLVAIFAEARRVLRAGVRQRSAQSLAIGGRRSRAVAAPPGGVAAQRIAPSPSARPALTGGVFFFATRIGICTYADWG